MTRVDGREETKKRQIVLDTETTGLEAKAGHRIIEIGCVELIGRRPTRRTFHRYINPDRAVEAGALDVHGISDDFLAEQPRFAEIADEFLDFVRGAELVIHNADFDIEFINHELRRLKGSHRDVRDCCDGVLDTLTLAREMHPGQRNSLDALARRYDVDNSMRELHGALLDAQILAEIYLAMTGGQVSLLLDAESGGEQGEAVWARIAREGLVLPVLRANAEETASHEAFLAKMRERCGGETIWERVLGSSGVTAGPDAATGTAGPDAAAGTAGQDAAAGMAGVAAAAGMGDVAAAAGTAGAAAAAGDSAAEVSPPGGVRDASAQPNADAAATTVTVPPMAAAAAADSNPSRDDNPSKTGSEPLGDGGLEPTLAPA